ncbi:unnamed protein product [Euphydryas editha]|uniref:Uncharacterized protein n=1 Tax=Euphydryas editha TaxID=104508 RepID=A0AAU9TLM5_EUPED|nr:unnamed protein product [Euphydryas editha]CAH2086646.1 unnamed protein product [Euphydryas editha]
MNCAYYHQHGGPHPAPHNVNNNYFNEVSIDPVSADPKDMKILVSTKLHTMYDNCNITNTMLVQ